LQIFGALTSIENDHCKPACNRAKGGPRRKDSRAPLGQPDIEAKTLRQWFPVGA